MMTTTDHALYKRHRYPTEIISYAVWLYYRFTLSYRDVEELLAARGIGVSYEWAYVDSVDKRRTLNPQ